MDAINAMVKRLGDESYYLAYNAATGKYRIFGDCEDSHSESYLYAVLTFDEDRLCVSLQDCGYREYLVCRPRLPATGTGSPTPWIQTHHLELGLK